MSRVNAGLNWFVPVDHPLSVGKYEIERFLGGGMSHVYRARDTVLGRRVALKILTEQGAADAESKARFLMEARLASNVAHENIISVYDFGEENGRPFIVMEFLEGESLRAAIRNGHLGDFASRLKIALQVGRAIDYIHLKKIIHRDIKPENIHIDPSGKAKMMDFGIAKPEGMKLTRAGFTLGTPYYMAPEQVLGQPLTPQADVYSFGVLLFEMLTGKKAIDGDSVDKVFERVLYLPVDLEPLRSLHVPPEIVSLIERCLIKQPAQRPRGFGEVCAEMERALNRPATVLLEHAARVPAPPKPRPPEHLPPLISKLPPHLRTQTSLVMLAGAMAALLVTVTYVILALTHVI